MLPVLMSPLGISAALENFAVVNVSLQSPCVRAHCPVHLTAQVLPWQSLRSTEHSAAGVSGNAPPYLAAAQRAVSSGQAPPKAARLGAVGRVRHLGLLNGVIPGSSAAAAAVNLYNGNAGAGLDC